MGNRFSYLFRISWQLEERLIFHFILFFPAEFFFFFFKDNACVLTLKEGS